MNRQELSFSVAPPAARPSLCHAIVPTLPKTRTTKKFGEPISRQQAPAERLSNTPAEIPTAHRRQGHTECRTDLFPRLVPYLRTPNVDPRQRRIRQIEKSSRAGDETSTECLASRARPRKPSPSNTKPARLSSPTTRTNDQAILGHSWRNSHALFIAECFMTIPRHCQPLPDPSVPVSAAT